MFNSRKPSDTCSDQNKKEFAISGPYFDYLLGCCSNFVPSFICWTTPFFYGFKMRQTMSTSLPKVSPRCTLTLHLKLMIHWTLSKKMIKWGFWHSEEIIMFWLKFGCCNLPPHLLKALAICWSSQWKDFKTRFRCCPNYLWVKIEQIVQQKVIFHTYWSITCEEDDWFNLQFRRHAHLVWRE